MGKILTVKVAASGVEKYIARCLDSFIDESYQNDIEVIVVNNRCADRTLEIVREYEKKYPNIFRVVAQEDKGYASTFNVGFEMATGKYFANLDGDDYFDSEALFRHIQFLKQADCDAVISNIMGVYEKTGEKKPYIFKNVEYGKVYNFKEICLETASFSAHMLTIKTSILQENGIKVYDDSVIADFQYEIFVIPYIETVVYLDNYLYHYRTGLSGQATSIEKVQTRAAAISKEALRLVDWCQNTDVDVQRKRYLTVKVGRLASNALYSLLVLKISRQSYNFIKQYMKKMRGKEMYSYTSIFFKMLDKLGYITYLFLAIAYRIYKKFSKFYW